jgi:hypothetical protein
VPAVTPPRAPSPPDLGGTVLGAVSPFAAPLPFAPKDAAPPPAAPAVVPGVTPPRAPSPPDLGGTVLGAVSPFAAPLPFVPKDAAAPPAAPAAVPAATPPRAPPAPDLGGTLVTGVSPFAAPLPFAPKEAAPAAAPQRDPSEDDTTIERPSPLRAPLQAPVTGGALSPAAARITLAHHASLRAEIAVAPETAAAVYQRYGIVGAAEREALDHAWRERLQRNPAEQQEWQRLHADYRAYWLAQLHRKNVPPR